MDKNKFILGFLILTILASGIVYVQLTDKVKIRVDEDKTTFYTPHEDYSWVWTVAGREYNGLFDGTSKMNRDLSSIVIDTKIEGNKSWITRNTTYIRGPKIVDTYFFDGNIEDVELFPISHTVEIYNGSGYFYRYEVRDLEYNGETKKLDTTHMSFGKNMEVEWQEGFRWAWVYKTGILKVQYDIDSDYENYSVRLFDPTYYDFNVTITSGLTFSFLPTNETEINVSATGQNSTLGIFTVHNNLTNDLQIVSKLNETNNNITFYIGNSSNYSLGIEMNASYQEVYGNLSINDTQYLWAWADFNNSKRAWYPEFEIKGVYI